MSRKRHAIEFLAWGAVCLALGYGLRLWITWRAVPAVAETVEAHIEPKLTQRLYRNEFLNWRDALAAWDAGGRVGPMPTIVEAQPDQPPARTTDESRGSS